MFKTQDYSFVLPEALIATEALPNRDASRLLVVHRQARKIEHRSIQDLPQILDANYRVVANNTKVFRARLLGRRKSTQGKIEFFLLERLSEKKWKGLMRSAARVLPGFEFEIGEGEGMLEGKVVDREESNSGVVLTAEFSKDPTLTEWGEVPLPPYIVANRQAPIDHRSELERYNTIFASEEGSVAAPTAGRHFTPELVEALLRKGIRWDEITLHVGLGTFKPVTVADVREHQMHSEWTTISAATAARLNEWKSAGKKILSVGTTTTRALEGFYNSEKKELGSGSRGIQIFIHPGSGHTWAMADAMLTNFHLPESTLLMMVADFVGDLEWLKQIYQEAISMKYRFYSYGDAMLIL